VGLQAAADLGAGLLNGGYTPFRTGAGPGRTCICRTRLGPG